MSTKLIKTSPVLPDEQTHYVKNRAKAHKGQKAKAKAKRRAKK